jgi:hypothetical protein
MMHIQIIKQNAALRKVVLSVSWRCLSNRAESLAGWLA